MREGPSITGGSFYLIINMKNKKQITAIVLVLFSSCLWGQNIQNHYVSRNVDGGMLYFIKPLKLFQSCKNTCYFDQTIRPHNDTISVGMTFTNRQAFKVDSIVFMNDDTIIRKKAQHLFTEQVNNKWDCRFFIYFTHKELELLHSDLPPTLSFYGMGNSNIQLKVKPNDWKKILEIDKTIYNQIKLNEK